MGIIGRDKFHPTFHEAREGDVAGQTVEFGDCQHGTAAVVEQVERGGELGPVALPTAFDFGELCYQLTRSWRKPDTAARCTSRPFAPGT